VFAGASHCECNVYNLGCYAVSTATTTRATTVLTTSTITTTTVNTNNLLLALILYY